MEIPKMTTRASINILLLKIIVFPRIRGQLRRYEPYGGKSTMEIPKMTTRASINISHRKFHFFHEIVRNSADMNPTGGNRPRRFQKRQREHRLRFQLENCIFNQKTVFSFSMTRPAPDWRPWGGGGGRPWAGGGGALGAAWGAGHLLEFQGVVRCWNSKRSSRGMCWELLEFRGVIRCWNSKRCD